MPREARVNARLQLEVLDGAVVGELGIDVFADVAAGEEVDEAAAAAGDDVAAGGDEGGYFPYVGGAGLGRR